MKIPTSYFNDPFSWLLMLSKRRRVNGGGGQGLCGRKDEAILVERVSSLTVYSVLIAF